METGWIMFPCISRIFVTLIASHPHTQKQQAFHERTHTHEDDGTQTHRQDPTHSHTYTEVNSLKDCFSEFCVIYSGWLDMGHRGLLAPLLSVSWAITNTHTNTHNCTFVNTDRKKHMLFPQSSQKFTKFHYLLCFKDIHRLFFLTKLRIYRLSNYTYIVVWFKVLDFIVEEYILNYK